MHQSVHEGATGHAAQNRTIIVRSAAACGSSHHKTIKAQPVRSGMGGIDVIPWIPDRMLAWSDFKADPHPAKPEDAHSEIRYSPRWMVGSEQGEGHGAIYFVIEDLQISTEFWPVLSWARPLCGSAELRHQQGHFDLGEIVLRTRLPEIRRSLYGRRFPTRGKNEEQRKQFARDDSARVIEYQIVALREDLALRQDEYNTTTRNGADAKAQSKYDSEFEALRQ